MEGRENQRRHNHGVVHYLAPAAGARRHTPNVRQERMITKWIALSAATVISGLWWEVGSNCGLAFNTGGRPIALAAIIALLWATNPFRTRLVLLIVAVLLSNFLANLTYALQTDPWYVTSDSETQLWIVISVVIQIGVALVALLAITRMRRNRMSNHASHATSETAPGAASSSREG